MNDKIYIHEFIDITRLFRIYEGTSQIQQLVIARQALRARTPTGAAGR